MIAELMARWCATACSLSSFGRRSNLFVYSKPDGPVLAYHKDEWDYRIAADNGEVCGQGRVKGTDGSCAWQYALRQYPELKVRTDLVTSVSRVRKNIASRFIVWLFQLEKTPADGLDGGDNADRLGKASTDGVSVTVIEDSVSSDVDGRVNLDDLHSVLNSSTNAISQTRAQKESE